MGRGVNRGELWTVAGGINSSKPRPALIVQDDLFGTLESMTVAPLTSTLTDASLIRVRIPSSDLSGLDRTSDVMVDKLTTVRCANIRDRVGRLSSAQLVDVERAMLMFLGLAR